tara:strand:+ start:7304 stop:8518 length:1215 start_codon:yes stop_codon:yes gene_type:complete
MTVYKDFLPGDIITDQAFSVETEGLFSDARQGTVNVFLSSSTQYGSGSTATGKYYMNIYTSSQALTDNQHEFAIAWGHFKGSGSFNSATGTGLESGAVNKEATPSNAVWHQFINTLRNAGGVGTYSDAAGRSRDERHGLMMPFLLRNNVGDLLVPGVNGEGRYNQGSGMWITFNRKRYKEGIDPTSFEMHFSSSKHTHATGENVYLKLVADTTQELYFDHSSRGLRIYPLRSGSRVSASSPEYLFQGGSNTVSVAEGPQSSSAYGYLFPDVGIAWVHTNAMTVSMSSEFKASTVAKAKNINQHQFLKHIKFLKARSQSTRKSQYYFCRAFNGEFNYSTNRSFYTVDTDGTTTPRHLEMIENPVVYVTTIGLYNDFNELVAVAKLSKPFRKTYDRELLFRVKLDF